MKEKATESLKATAVRVDYNDLCVLYGISQTPLIKACISYLVDQILSQQVSASIDIGTEEHPIEWLEDYFKGGNKANIRNMIEDLMICGFCLIKYERTSSDLPEMEVDYEENERVTHMMTKNRMTYADPNKEQDATMLSKTSHIVKSLKKIGYIPKRLSPTSCRVTFTSNKYGDPARFFVYPILSEVGGMVIKTDSLRDPLENVRVFFLPNTFVTHSIATVTGRKTGTLVRVLSDVSSIKDEYTRAFNLANYSEVTIQKSSNPSWFVFKPRDTVYDMSAPAMSDVRFGNDQMTPKDGANYRTFNAKTEMALVKSSHGEQSVLYRQHKKYLEGMIEDEFERNSVSREAWFRQMPYTPPPGYEVGFWPVLPFNESFLKFVDSIKTDIAMRFGVQLQGLVGKMSGNTTAEQSMNLMREVSQHKMSELKITIQTLMLFIGYDSVKSSIRLDMQDDVGSRDGIRNADEPSSESEFETSSSESESEDSESDRDSKKTKKKGAEKKGSGDKGKAKEKVAEKKKKEPKLARKEKEQRRSKHRGGTYGMKLSDDETSSNSDSEEDSDEREEEDEEREEEEEEDEGKKRKGAQKVKKPKVKKPKRKTLEQFTNEVMNNITFNIELISSQTNIEEMILLRDAGAVSDYTFNRWAASKFNLPFEEGASKKAKKEVVEAPAAPAAKPKPKAAATKPTTKPAAAAAPKPKPKPTSITAPKPAAGSKESPASKTPSSGSKPSKPVSGEKGKGKEGGEKKPPSSSSPAKKDQGAAADSKPKKAKKAGSGSDSGSDDDSKKKKKTGTAAPKETGGKEKGKGKPSSSSASNKGEKESEKNKSNTKTSKKDKDSGSDTESDKGASKDQKKNQIADKGKEKEGKSGKRKATKGSSDDDTDSNSDDEPKKKKPKVLAGEGKGREEDKKKKK